MATKPKPIVVKLADGTTARVDQTLFRANKEASIEAADAELKLSDAEREGLEAAGQPEHDPMTYMKAGPRMLVGIMMVPLPKPKSVAITYQLCESGAWKDVYIFKSQIVTEMDTDGKLSAIARGDILLIQGATKKEAT